MKTYISLSKFPGTTGKYFYTEFFKHYNLDATYEPRACEDIQQELSHALSEGVSGISISMPYKQKVISALHSRSSSVRLYNSCNTIVNDQSVLTGYNADLAGVEYVCKNINIGDRVTILGAGAVGSMFIKYLEHSHYGNLNVCARSLNTWSNRFAACDIVINCTALGTISDESPYGLGQLHPEVRMVVDLAIKENDLSRQCKIAKVKYMSGREFYRAQFIKQFEIYTGIVPDIDVYNQFESKLYETV